ncbi:MULTISPECIES: OmpA family protein [unclassified Rhizobium]|uniref:OmpA family protein n=1 Tax=unclassified Rhizobium TaxID=2613769 RepID=UPI00144866F7|nr:MULTISPECIES: OmpA family protein [unclassified Rhizobium]NKJ07913.1 outer membrane protein OmpA-like peptidoglycan-associated protein [Rhizobium sp. SG741]NKJ36845.1 outer membrane protein OmpA-like peptidoglycan-associated protein [Rhizobium sp. SG570]
MRGSVRRSHQEEEEESAFVSMTDMTVSFLFIVMLLLAFFASQYSETDKVPRSQLVAEQDARKAAEAKVEDLQKVILEKDVRIQELTDLVKARDSTIDAQKQLIADLQAEIAQLVAKIKELEAKLNVADPLEAYLADAREERRRILEKLKIQLNIDFPDLKVELSEQSDALRFQGDGLFATNSFELRPDRKQIVTSVAKRLSEILPCYTVGQRSSWNDHCNPGGVVIEALQIEGHTDGTGQPIGNLTLSTNRANSTFIAMTESEPGLIDFQNLRRQPVLSVAGYGQMRPVADNATKAGRDTNRRVDIRIIMYTPGRSEDVERIRKALAIGNMEGIEN